MRVDVITLQAVKNYGSVLQAYATQELIKEHGCDVTIINYVRESGRDENLIQTWAKGNILKKIAITPTVKKWIKVFGKFYCEYLNLTEKIYTTEEDFKSYPLDADIFCTGSDQVWNSKWNKGIIGPLYLSFVPENKYKFALAASFGQERLDKDEVRDTYSLIHEYQHISAREDSGRNILIKQYKYDKAVQVIDPTLGLSPEIWRKIRLQRKVKGDYILVYNLNRSKKFDNYALRLSKITGLKLVRLCLRYDQILRPGKSIVIPEVPDFIGLIDDAKYVLTDSFHATAFSMNLNTEPICIYPEKFGGRIESFLRLTNSLHRHVKNFDDFDVLNRPVNFHEVNLILDRQREAINAYLTTVFNSAKEFYKQ